MKAEDLINFRALSRFLTGSPTKIHSKFTPKEYKKTVNDLKITLNYWLEGKIVVSEEELDEVLSEFLTYTKEKLKERG